MEKAFEARSRKTPANANRGNRRGMAHAIAPRTGGKGKKSIGLSLRSRGARPFSSERKNEYRTAKVCITVLRRFGIASLEQLAHRQAAIPFTDKIAWFIAARCWQRRLY